MTEMILGCSAFIENGPNTMMGKLLYKMEFLTGRRLYKMEL
jgi:hypothetical protein